MATIVAKWDSLCSSVTCGQIIESGTEIGYYDDEVMHAECAELEAEMGAVSEFMPLQDRAPRPAAHCDTCWCPKPCFCDGEGD